MSDFLKMIGEQIRYIRKSKDLTQQTLSELTGLQLSYISDVERGERNISLETFYKITAALDVPPTDIFKFTSTEVVNELVEKQMVIESLRALLNERTIEEVKFINRVTRDFVHTVDSNK